MIFLSDSAIKYSVNICTERSNYRVGIAIYDPNIKIHVQNQICDICGKLGDGLVQRIVGQKHNFRVDFENGSNIRFLNTTGSSRGVKTHLLVLDEGIPYELWDNVRRTEVLDMMEYFHGARNLRTTENMRW